MTHSAAREQEKDLTAPTGESKLCAFQKSKPKYMSGVRNQRLSACPAKKLH
jgi:hypothetical protein